MKIGALNTDRFSMDGLMKRHSLFIAALLAVLSHAQARVESPSAPIVYSEWIKTAMDAFRVSPIASQSEQSVASANLAFREYIYQNPLSMKFDFSLANSKGDPAYDSSLETVQTRAYRGVGTLDYKNLQSLELRLDTNFTMANLQQPAIASSTNPYQISLRLGYDLLQGGDDGAGMTNQKIYRMQSLQKKSEGENELLAARVRFARLLTDFYVLHCKIAIIHAAQGLISKTVQTGQVQLKTRTISYKDYLNFIDLENGFARDVAALELEEQSQANQIAAWGDAAATHAALLTNFSPSCQLPIGELTKRAESSKLSEQDIEVVADSLPSMRASEAARAAATLAVQSARLGNRPSLIPYVEGDTIQPDYRATSYNAGVVGISLQWNLPGHVGEYALAASRAGAGAATAQVRVSRLSNRSLVNDLLSQVRNQIALLNTLERSAKTSEELLKTLTAQRALGQIDSLNYANSYVSYMSVLEGQLDSWGAFEKASIELEFYRDRAKSQQ